MEQESGNNQHYSMIHPYGSKWVAISDGVWSSAYCKGWLPVEL